MKRELTLSSAASRDLASAHSWYEEQSEGLGTEFMEAVDTTFAIIDMFPHRFPYFIEDVRRALVDRFPYAISYREEIDRIFILGVLHTSRDPGILKERLR